MRTWAIHAVYNGNKTYSVTVETSTLITALFLGKKRWPNADTIVCTGVSGATNITFPATLNLKKD